ncbi:MAG: hypothetical protein WA734_12195 [Candidatus Acidiferrales bacterium]
MKLEDHVATQVLVLVNQEKLRECHATIKMKTSLRQILADSHISAVAIAVLLIWSLDSILEALWGPTLNAANFLFTAVAILGLPHNLPIFGFSERFMLLSIGFFLFNAFSCLAAAWLLSRRVYGTGPFRSLKSCGERFVRRSHA